MTHAQATTSAARPAPISKVADVVVYQNDAFYCAFPSVVRQPDGGELLLALRRAPEWRRFGGRGTTHTDANAQLVLTRSRDGGRTWGEPSLLHADPLAGLQDPCLARLNDGSLLCSTYGWMWLPLPPPSTQPLSPNLTDVTRVGDFVFTGGLLLRSADAGRSWETITPPPAPTETRRDPFGQPLPAYNRGAICQGRTGRLFWAVAVAQPGDRKRTGVHLMTSDDRGRTWSYGCPIAQDDKVEFNEAGLYETPAADLVAFVRTAHFDDHTVVARSSDGGKRFGPWQDAGFRGHPHHATRLSDGRVLLVYGYRHPPFGVRARVLDTECLDVATAPEFVVRDDGGNGDLGYPWAVALDDRRALVVYYFNRSDGPRHIAGTIVEIAPR